MKPTTYNLPTKLTKEIGQIARQSERSRSYVVRKLLESALTGTDRLAALTAIAAAELEDEAANRQHERGPNSGQIIADSSADGHRRLAALGEIAKGSK